MPLPEWNVRKLERGRLRIECPRRDCGGTAVVTERWLDGERLSTPDARPCSYCFWAARIPLAFRPETR